MGETLSLPQYYWQVLFSLYGLFIKDLTPSSAALYTELACSIFAEWENDLWVKYEVKVDAGKKKNHGYIYQQ